MRIRHVHIENFRGISSATVEFGEKTLFVGPNNMGKTTIFEALDLALGPDRARGPDAIEEHDFYRGEYFSADACKDPSDPEVQVAQGAREIRIEVVLSDLVGKEMGRFRKHIEPWKEDESRPYTGEELEDYAPSPEEYVLRIGFHGWYDPAEDEFLTESYYLCPPPVEGGSWDSFGRHDKRQVGFLYLRSLRTASRAASLQRGSLLDILLQLREARPRMWAALLSELQNLGVTVGSDPNVREVLDDLERGLGKYLPRQHPIPPKSQLHVSQLTRSHLRNLIVYFLESASGAYMLPFQRMGSGVTNLLVLALLSSIADRKDNVIFAMEEPEIALSPHTQRRIINEVGRLSSQLIVTSHSPYVAERFLEETINVLDQTSDGSLVAHCVQHQEEVKLKSLKRDFRLKYSEGLLAPAVLVVEGYTEYYAIPEASEKLSSVADTKLMSLDSLGVVVVNAQTNSNIPRVLRFYKELGITALAMFDNTKDEALKTEIVSVADWYFELEYTGFEKMLIAETGLLRLKAFWATVSRRDDFGASLPSFSNESSEEAIRAACLQILKGRKGEGYGALLVRRIAATQMPLSLLRLMALLQKNLTSVGIPESDPLSEVLRAAAPEVLEVGNAGEEI